MSQNQTINSSNNKDNSFRSLWIGELEQWMDTKYLIESCLSYSKSYYF